VSTTKPQITIVGLGLIGGSVGMALRQAQVTSAVIGHDIDQGVSKKARKLEAVDKTDWNLISACEESDLIVLAIPLGGIEETLKAIGPYLRSGSVVVDTASLKGPVLAWADEILPDHVHFVGMNPIVGGTDVASKGLDAARVDLFQKRLICLVPSSKADPEVVKLASDLVTVLGARPLFMDPVEHDGLMGAMDQLPPLAALALLDATVGQPAWRELRKVAGAAYETGTFLFSDDPTVYTDLFLTNRDNVVRWIDALTASLASIRQSLLEDGPEAINDRFESLVEERNRWLRDRSEGQWEMDRAPEVPRPNILVDTFLGGLWRKRPKKGN
jgi:prephenate dehydrogenase